MATQGRRAALVTGAGSGIGRAIALELGQQGFGVSVVEFTESQGQETVELLQEQNAKSPGLSADFIFTKCDVTKPDQLSGAFERHLKHFGRIDVVVNNAGIGVSELFMDTSTDGKGTWRRMVDVNFTAVMDGTRLAVHAMKKLKCKGAIINVASAAGLYPSPNAPVYHGTKGGVVMFTRCLAYLAKEGIRVSALCPEFLDTPMVREQLIRKDRILEKQLATLGGFISMEMLMDGFRTLLADEASPGQCMWVTRRFGCQYWPFKKEGAKWQIKPKQPAPGGAAHGQTTFRKIVVHTLTTNFRAATHIVEAPLPLSLPAGHVLIRNLYAGINASDVNYSAGVYHGSKEVAARNLPLDAGFEAVGLIAAVGEGMGSGKHDAGLVVNAPAATLRYGGFAEYSLVPARQVLPVPSAAKEVVAMLTSGLTASVALEQAGQMGTGQTVLVTAAAGGTGQFAVQLAKLAGNRVVATCGGAAKADLLRSLHVDVVIDYTRDDVTATLKRECPGGVDLVYESVGGDMFKSCLNALAPGGKLIVIGMMSQYTANSSGEWQRTSVPGLTERLLWKSQSLAGFFLPNYAQHFKRHLSKLATLHAAGMLQVAVDPRPFVGLESIPDAVEYLQSGKSLGKVVVEIAKGSPVTTSRL